VECLYDLVGVVGNEIGKTLVQGLLTAWNQGTLRGWRERELVVKKLPGWANLLGLECASLARTFLAKGLEDNVAAVRDATISTMSQLYAFYASRKDVINDFRGDLQNLATSPVYRKRMTFIACQQKLALSADKNNEPLVALDSNFFRSVTDLADDDIEGVRIGVARFVGLVYGNLLRRSHSIPSELLDLIHRLSKDPCHGVQSYLYVDNLSSDNDPSLANYREARKRRLRISTFSRPPPPKDQTEGPSMVSPYSHRIISEPHCNGGTSATQTPNMGVLSPLPRPPSPTQTPKEEIRRANDRVTLPDKIFIT
jgi:serine/threonine-protein phosphatase 4 regulatory subunit 1